MYLYDVSKPTKLSLVREVKDGDASEFKRLVKKVKTSTDDDNLKLWLTAFFESICDIMSMCDNENGSTNRHLPSWFTKEIVLNEHIKDMDSRIKCDSSNPKPFENSYKILYGRLLLSQLLITATIKFPGSVFLS
jgi:hypothetical protein